MATQIAWPLARNRIRRGMENHTFGMVRRNRDGTRRPHQGWDFHALDGTPCFAVADGVITGIKNAGDYGLQVTLRFKFDFDGDGKADSLFAFYAHLSRCDVKVGQSVSRGERIGLTGSSGNAKGMGPDDQHLHFELRGVPHPGLGLAGRYSPLAIFKVCPLKEEIVA
jgi:murein DD-endopeptidase MepM/ murein hydrolase activator NlpD